MEPVEAIRQLWSRKLLLGLVLVIAVFAAILSAYKISPSGLQSRSLTVGAASSQILVDSKKNEAIAGEASLGSFEALAIRAKIYAEYLSSLEARQKIADFAGVPARSISSSGPFSVSAAQGNYPSQTSEDRANEILEEGAGNRLVFTAQEGVPIITVDAQSATADRAVALANGSYKTLGEYVGQLKVDGKDADEAVVVRELGAPEGGIIGGGNDMILMVLAFLVVMALGCIAILFVPRFTQRWRALNQYEQGDKQHIPDFETPYSVPVRKHDDHHPSHGYDPTPLAGDEHQHPVAPRAAHLP
jgi:capsular polysaccharide biosynthesis protein